MSKPLDKIKPGVRQLTTDHVNSNVVGVKLNQNESPFDLPQAIKDEVLRRLSHRAWNHYPDSEPTDLLERLAEFIGWRPDGIVIGSGSSDLIQTVLLATVGAEAKV